MVWHFTPYCVEKNLGKSYNDYLSLIPDGDSACIRDGDTLFLSSDWGDIIHEYAKQNPNAVLVCRANRIHPLGKEQLYKETVSLNSDITREIRKAHIIKQKLYKTTPCHGPLSGFLMVIPKSVWKKVPFREGRALLGVDTFFYKDLREAGIPILRMEGLFIWHTYRLVTNIKDIKHLAV